MDNTKKKTRIKRGIVVSDKMSGTVAVLVNRLKKHPLYKKRYKVSKKYMAHANKDGFKIGDKVLIRESRPMSRHKKWEVIKKI